MSELSKQTFAEDSGDGVAAADVEVLDSVLESYETVRYAMVSSKGIEHTTESRTTTIQPDSNHSTYAVVTGFRILFLVGTKSEDLNVDLEFNLGSITSANARSGLLSSSLIVTADQTESVKFVPTKDADPEEVADYLERMASSWQDLEHSLAGAREAIADFEVDLESGEDTHEDVQAVRTRLNSAIHAATRNDDAPTEHMMDRIESIEEELETLLVRSRMDRVDVLLEEAGDARDQGDLADAIEAIVEADERLVEAKRDLEGVDVPDDEATEAVAEREDAVATLGAALLEDAVGRCAEAAATDDPMDRVAAWKAARERFETAIDAGWDGLADVSGTALEFQRAWIVGRQIDALRAAALASEETGDELGEGHDDAHDHYETAKERFQAARTLAEEFPHATPGDYEEPLDRLEGKLEVSEWEWGQA